jgi:hypothetical protein
VAGAVPDDPEGGHVAGDGAGVPGGGVDLELARPQVEAVQVDLGRRPVAELEVEGGLLDPQRRLAGAGRVAGVSCLGQRIQRAGHLADQELGRAAPAGSLPGRGHGLGPGGDRVPASGAGRGEGVPGAAGQDGQPGRWGAADGVDRHGQGDRLEVAAATGGELAVARS